MPSPFSYTRIENPCCRSTYVEYRPANPAPTTTTSKSTAGAPSPSVEPCSSSTVIVHLSQLEWSCPANLDPPISAPRDEPVDARHSIFGPWARRGRDTLVHGGI